MITFLKGDFIVKGPASVVIDVNGVGYEVLISLNTFSKIQHLDKGQLHTSLLVREILTHFMDFLIRQRRRCFCNS
jgi:Holliday junction DNA helicase RuvA